MYVDGETGETHRIGSHRVRPFSFAPFFVYGCVGVYRSLWYLLEYIVRYYYKLSFMVVKVVRLLLGWVGSCESPLYYYYNYTRVAGIIDLSSLLCHSIYIE